MHNISKTVFGKKSIGNFTGPSWEILYTAPALISRLSYRSPSRDSSRLWRRSADTRDGERRSLSR